MSRVIHLFSSAGTPSAQPPSTSTMASGLLPPRICFTTGE